MENKRLKTKEHKEKSDLYLYKRPRKLRFPLNVIDIRVKAYGQTMIIE